MPPGAEVPIEVTYRSRGLGDWTLRLRPRGRLACARFRARDEHRFRGHRLPGRHHVAHQQRQGGDGWRLTWRFASLVTGQRIGMDLPRPPEPGPLAARITWFAPVGLLFFLTVMVILGVLRGHNLHPMNYAFVCAAFFAFHLLLAYLVDHLDLHLSFAIAA